MLINRSILRISISCLILRHGNMMFWINYRMLNAIKILPVSFQILIICIRIFQALLHSVPLGKLIVLDLYAEVKPIWATSKQFYGTPYIWKVTLLFFICASDVVFNVIKFQIVIPIVSMLFAQFIWPISDGTNLKVVFLAGYVIYFIE